MFCASNLLLLALFCAVPPAAAQRLDGNNTAEDRNESSPQGSSSGSCTTPPYPENGKYEVAGAPTALPGQAFDNMQLNISCSPGFSVIGNSVLFCINGIWSDELPQCARSCKVERHPSVNYTCYRLEGGFRRCSDYEPVGTVMRASCSPGYYNDGDLNNMNCTDSGWDQVTLCSPDCGKVGYLNEYDTPTTTTTTTPRSSNKMGDRHYFKSKPLLAGILSYSANLAEFPWHTAIYKYRKPSDMPSYYQQICGGSLVSTTVVISAAHCFWDSSKQKPWPASMFHVAVGKLNRFWNDPDDEETVQKSDVYEIKIPARFQGVETNFQDDIAIIILTTAITYKWNIKPICVDFDTLLERKQLQAGSIGKVAGWGFAKANGTLERRLRSAYMPYVDIVQCIQESPPGFKRYITSDKICAGYTNGTALCKGDSGGGLVFLEEIRYYLRGIVSTAPTSNDACNLFARGTFTLISAHKLFIEENIVLHSQVALKSNIDTGPEQLCILPAHPEHGLYSISGSPTAYPGEAFHSVQLNIDCDAGYSAEGNKTLYCREGIWSANLPRCKRFCKLDRDPGVIYWCLINRNASQHYECSEEEPSGTVIWPYCRAEKLPPMRCDDGLWSINLGCTPKCGVAGIQAKGNKVERGVVPWHAQIYRKLDKVGNETAPATLSYNIWCSGTLVSTTVVISAAQCFWSHTNEQVPASRYAVAVDKVYSKWDDIRDSVAQKSLVKDVKIPSRFRGRLTNLQNDISLVILSTAVTLSQYVKPVCLDFDINFDRRQLQEGNVGKTYYLPMVYDEIGEVFEMVDVSNVNIDVCITEKKALGMIEYVTADKSCVRALNSSPVSTANVCRVISGAGVVFAETSDGIERHYLRGIVSPTQPIICSLNTSLSVTNIRSHEHFIKKYQCDRILSHMPPRPCDEYLL